MSYPDISMRCAPATICRGIYSQKKSFSVNLPFISRVYSLSAAGNCPGWQAEGADMVGRIESDIERQAEALMDSLDARYLNSSMTVEEYASQVRAIERWTQEAFAACPVRW